jgi:hypothetical protein
VSSRDARIDWAADFVRDVLLHLAKVRPTAGLPDEERAAANCARAAAEALFSVRRALDELGFAEWACERDKAPGADMAAVRMARGNLVIVVEQIAKLVVTMGEQDERRDAARALAEATYAAHLALGELAMASPPSDEEASRVAA